MNGLLRTVALAASLVALAAPALAQVAPGSAQAVSQSGPWAFSIIGSVPSGGNVMGRVAIDQTTPGTTNAVAVTASPIPSGGMTTVSRIVSSAASTNTTVAKASAGRVYKITGLNASNAIRWLHLYNTASAPTVGTTTVFFALPLPPGAYSFDAQDLGYSFSAGIAYSVTTGASDSDATATAAGDILNLNVWYQ